MQREVNEENKAENEARALNGYFSRWLINSRPDVAEVHSNLMRFAYMKAWEDCRRDRDENDSVTLKAIGKKRDRWIKVTFPDGTPAAVKLMEEAFMKGWEHCETYEVRRAEDPAEPGPISRPKKKAKKRATTKRKPTKKRAKRKR